MDEDIIILGETEESSEKAKKKERTDVVYQDRAERVRKTLKFQTMSSQLILASLLVFIFLMISMMKNETDILTKLETELMDDRLQSDIHYIADTIGADYWIIDGDGYIRCGETRIGDGTEEHANYEPFLKHQDKTGTFSYVFKICGDEGLTWVGDQQTGYQQGHYIRVAGSTKNPDGSSLVGTYIDVKVANELDNAGYYAGPANVNGNMIYCYYEALKTRDGKTAGCIVVGRNMSELQDMITQSKGSTAVLFVVCIFVSILGMAVLVMKWLKDIRRINSYVETIADGEIPDETLKVKSKDEIAEVANSINNMTDALKDNKRMGAELSIATAIQMNIMPKDFPDESEFCAIYASMHPAKEVGGDFYDFFIVDDTHRAVVIGDVSGKGVPAALFMAITKTLIKDHAQLGVEPEMVFKKVNHKLCKNNEMGMFVTCWIGIANTETGEFQYVNAGHNPPLLRRNGGDYEYLRSKPGLVLAAFEDFDYTVETTYLKPGDKLLLYTDGVTEAVDANNYQYGEERLARYLNHHKDDGVRETIEGLVADVNSFVGDVEQFDDMTMLIASF